MADEAEDVLELDTELEVQEDEEVEEQETEAEQPDDEAEPEGEAFIGFEGEEEAAPAPESESSVIRDLRRVNRDQAKRLAELERGNQPKPIEVGEKPTLESCEYDEDRFYTALDAWTARRAEADRQKREAEEQAEKGRQEWEARAQAYETDKGRLGVADYGDAEAEVFSALPDDTKALIMLTEKPAALVYALHRSPSRLEELSKLNLARAAMMLGKLEDKVTVTKRKAPQPDRPVTGSTTPRGADKELDRLEREAERTGDRTKLIQYRKRLRESN